MPNSPRPCTPPPAPRDSHLGARVKLPVWLAPSMPTEAELDALEAPLHAQARLEADAVVFAEMMAMIANRPSVPARGKRGRS